ncbi:MAG: hypothetical protein Q8R92_20790 [Deltaproteobacteria bacterium]|nr:hypothetical protein [Deltaproteobacteria bacterium]
MGFRNHRALLLPMLLALVFLAPRGSEESLRQMDTDAPATTEAPSTRGAAPDAPAGVMRRMPAAADKMRVAPGAALRGAAGKLGEPLTAVQRSRAEGQAPDLVSRKGAFAKFAKEEQARQAAEAAKINEALAKLQVGDGNAREAKLEAIRTETLAIQSRARSGSPAARAADEKRLQDLQSEMDALVK